jgi:hypothetical protein
MSRNSRSQRRAILSATSALALIAGMGGNAWACSPMSGSFAFFTNNSTLDCLNFNNATVNGGVTNSSTGTIGPPSTPAPASVTVNNTSINGSLANSGHINASGGTPGGISVTGGSVITNGIINNSTGTISVSGSGPSAFGIQVSQSSFSGGITNSGVINVSNSSGSAVGIQVGGAVSPPPPPSPPPPASINPGSLTTTGIKTTTTGNTGSAGGTGFSSLFNHHKH